jgi:hypothetical protein
MVTDCDKDEGYDDDYKDDVLNYDHYDAYDT